MSVGDETWYVLAHMNAKRTVTIALLLALTSCGATQSPPAAVSREQADVQPRMSEPAAPVVRVGECPIDWLPPGVVRATSGDETEELAAQIRSWLEDGHALPRVELVRGIVFVKSADDEGADPPYPVSSAAASLRACGLTATWLRAHLRSIFASAAGPDMDGVTCDRNVCCVAGMEYVPNRAIVFRRITEGDEAVWIIESTYEVAEATLSEERVTENRRYVAGELTRLAQGSCPGEPPGLR